MPVTVLDARGLRCPLPVLRLRRAARPGMTIELVADDPAAAADVPAFAHEMGWPIGALAPLRWRIIVSGVS